MESEADLIDPRNNREKTEKERGAFFTPRSVTRFIADWAIQSATDRVLEPSCGEAAFLLSAVSRLEELARDQGVEPDLHVYGAELHLASAQAAISKVVEAGGIPHIEQKSFFEVQPLPIYDAVIGNPPFIRFHDFTGDSRTKAQAAALRAGVRLSGLASSWAAFVIYSALFLKPGGRMGFVLPAEFLTVDYAAHVRQFLLAKFSSIKVMNFDELVFDGAQADVVLLLASGYDEGPAAHAELHDAGSVNDLSLTIPSQKWQADEAGGKWTSGRLDEPSQNAYASLTARRDVASLAEWAKPALGVVTGNNKFFVLTETMRADHGLAAGVDVSALVPPLRGGRRSLSYTTDDLALDRERGAAVWLFSPVGEPSNAALEYIRRGESEGANLGYKCRNRYPWWRVPRGTPSHLIMTYMSAEIPRLLSNPSRLAQLNSVHRLTLQDGLVGLGMDLLPIAALSSMTLLSAELVGRTYGGGVLKLELRESSSLKVPAIRVLKAVADELHAAKPYVENLLREGEFGKANREVDNLVLSAGMGMDDREIKRLRLAHEKLRNERRSRSRKRSS